MPAAEALVCGTRPVCFQSPHYVKWFGEFADFVKEGSYQETVEDLTRLFRGEMRPVTDEERQVAVDRFNWATIVAGFWKEVLA